MGGNSAGIGLINTIVQSSGGALQESLVTQLETIRSLAEGGNAGDASTALAQLTGGTAVKGIETTLGVAQNFGGAVFGHLSQMRDTRTALREAPLRGRDALASLGGYDSPANRVWAGGFGVFMRQEDDNGNLGYKYDAGGFILGYDRHFGENITLGLTGAYSKGRVKGNGGFSETDVDTLNLGAYASYDPRSGFYAEANIGYGRTWNEENERQLLGGYRKGKFNTSSFQAGGNVGYAFLLPSSFRVIPTVGLQFIRVRQEEYAQTGTGAAIPMWRDAASANFVEVPLAVRVNRKFELASGISLTPELRAAWIWEARKDAGEVRAGYVGSAASMQLSGSDYGRNRALVGAGVKVRFTRSVDAFIDYNLEFRNKYQNHNIMAGVGISF